MNSKKILFTLFILLSLCAGCQAKPAGGLSVTGAWARPGEAGSNSAAYFTIHNGATTDDLLISSTSPVAGAVEIHQSMMGEDGVMAMSQMDSVPVLAGEKVDFIPGGYHIMLIDLSQDLNPSDTFTMTLTFENAREIELKVEVKEP
jgi:copper(I)-binding protein